MGGSDGERVGGEAGEKRRGPPWSGAASKGFKKGKDWQQLGR